MTSLPCLGWREKSTRPLPSIRVSRNSTPCATAVRASLYPQHVSLTLRLHCSLDCAGFFGSLVLIFAKSTAVLIRSTAEGDNQVRAVPRCAPLALMQSALALQFVEPLTYVFIVSMLGSIFTETHFLATGLRFFDALYSKHTAGRRSPKRLMWLRVAVVPVFQCFFITLGATAGGLFFSEFSRFSALQAALFPLGVLVTLTGVFILSSRQMNYGDEVCSTLSVGTSALIFMLWCVVVRCCCAVGVVGSNEFPGLWFCVRSKKWEGCIPRRRLCRSVSMHAHE